MMASLPPNHEEICSSFGFGFWAALVVGCCCCGCVLYINIEERKEERERQEQTLTVAVQQQSNPVSSPAHGTDRGGAPQPLPPGNAGASYVPPTMATPVAAVADAQAAPTARPQPKSLSATLADGQLAQYETALRELGAAFASDLAHLEERDLVEIGMRKLEITRLKRLAAESADDSTC